MPTSTEGQKTRVRLGNRSPTEPSLQLFIATSLFGAEKLGTARMSITKWADKRSVAYVHNGILINHKMMSLESQDKGNKAGRGQIPHASISMRRVKLTVRCAEMDTAQRPPKAREEENWQLLLYGYRVSVCDKFERSGEGCPLWIC